MAINSDPRPPYREPRSSAYSEPRSASTMVDIAAMLWIVVAVAAAAALIVWLLTATSVRAPETAQTNAGQSVETQPITPRNAPTP